MATEATIVLGSTVDVLGLPSAFEAVAIATLAAGRWTVVGIGGEFSELEGPESFRCSSDSDPLLHGLLALLASSEETYAAKTGALRDCYPSEGYRRATRPDAVLSEVLAAQVPRSWVLLLTVLPPGAITCEDVLAVTELGVALVPSWIASRAA